MKSNIPEYYRHLAEKPAEAARENAPNSGVSPRTAPPRANPGAVAAAGVQALRGRGSLPPDDVPTPIDIATEFQGNRFVLPLVEGWEDTTVYVVSGPLSDGVRHNVTIVVDSEAGAVSLDEYADLQIRPLQEELAGCRVLLRGSATLVSGHPAYRVVYSWSPLEGARFYQEQLYVLSEGVGYKLTATFTKKTRKTLGPQIERMMLGFEPRPVSDALRK